MTSQTPMSVLSQHAIEEIRELPRRFPPQSRSAVMPALDIAQEELGHLSAEAISEVASLLDLDAGYVQGVATFYTLFHLEPVGRHHFSVCTNLSCTLRDADRMVRHLLDAIDVSGPREVSADGLFSVEEVECLGACEYAPMLRVDQSFHYDLTPDKIEDLVAERRAAAGGPALKRRVARRDTKRGH